MHAFQYSNGIIVDTACIVCRAESMKLSGVRLSVCPSVPSFGRRTPLQWVCSCGPGGQEISIDCCTAYSQQQMRALPRCQTTQEAEHRLAIIIVLYKQKWLQFLFVVKATAVKQQISKFYPHTLSTEASYHIYTSQWPVINVKANFCA